MVKTVNHSGINFIDENVFHIETSELYKALGENVQSIEFVRSKGKQLLFVEAKSSFPNPNTKTPNPEKGNKTGAELFQEGIVEIYKKFTHSLQLYSSIAIGTSQSGFPQGYTPAKEASLNFLLVINNFKPKYCIPIKKAIANKLSGSFCMAKIWKPEVYVITHQEAIERGLAV